MSTELLIKSAVIRTLGSCGPPDPPSPSALSSELSVATGTPPNCAAAVRGLRRLELAKRDYWNCRDHRSCRDHQNCRDLRTRRDHWNWTKRRRSASPRLSWLSRRNPERSHWSAIPRSAAVGHEDLLQQLGDLLCIAIADFVDLDARARRRRLVEPIDPARGGREAIRASRRRPEWSSVARRVGISRAHDLSQNHPSP